MRGEIVVRVSRRGLAWAAGAVLVLALLAPLAQPLLAQKVQETFKDKFDIADEAGGVSIAASSDGRYVFVAGKNGVLVSDDYGKTGSWVQTVRMR